MKVCPSVGSSNRISYQDWGRDAALQRVMYTRAQAVDEALSSCRKFKGPFCQKTISIRGAEEK